MLQMLKNRLGVSLERKETGAAMIFAVLILMVMIMLSVVLSSGAVTQAKSSRDTNLREGYIAAANYGLENALFQANNATSTEAWLESKKGQANATAGTPADTIMNVDGLRWRVYTERVVASGNEVLYYVYSTGYLNTLGATEGVTLRAIFQGIPVTNGSYDINGKVNYTLSPESSWKYGATGLTASNITGTSKIYAADSTKTGNIPSGSSSNGAAVFSNGFVTIANANHGFKTVVAGVYGPGTGCKPTALCDTSGIVTKSLNSKMNLSSVIENVESICTNSSYPVWTASANGGIMNLPTDACVGGLVFDVNTTVPASFSAAAPLKVNVKGGNITVNANIRVNQTNSPTALVVRSNGASVTTATGSKMNVSLSTPSAICDLNGSTIFFGGIACNTLNVNDSSTIYLDQAINEKLNTSGRKVWGIAYVEEL